MKEFLINELAEQAGIEPVAIHNNPLVVSYHMSHETMDRFVELILKECIKINKQELAFNGVERLMSRYHEHFGVEK
jgi:hypothetical protein